MQKITPLFACIIGIFLLFAPTATATSQVAFEWTELSNSGLVSFHNTTGPVLADDFTPAISGYVVQVDWWGSAPLSTSGTDSWEITFHDNNNGEPAYTAPRGGISQHFVNAEGLDGDSDGIYMFSAIWDPEDVWLTAGDDYWFSVANDSGADWTWANPIASGPTVGSEQYEAVYSEGGLPSIIAGPHDGPWIAYEDQDFAFRIHVRTPEPATMLLLGIGLVGLAGVSRKKFIKK